MKILFASLISLMAFTPVTPLQLGQKAPMTDHVMKDLSNRPITLDQLKGKYGLVVIFSCNTCPFVIAWEDRYNELHAHAMKNNMGFVLINSNEAKRQGDDSRDQMILHAKEKGYADFPYLVDEGHKLADAFGATKTPDVFVFNGKMELVYKGAIDDNERDRAAVTKKYLMDAIDATQQGKVPDPSTTKSVGCSIKRMS
jgi:hypothetical protein